MPQAFNQRKYFMRFFALVKPVTLALLSGIVATLPSQAATPGYATVKLRVCKPCDMPSLPVALPRRGIVLAYGSIISDGSNWYLVDFERAEATRIFARLDRATSKLNIVEQVARSLPPGEQSSLTQLANRIWGNDKTLPTQMATDVVWDIWLIDGNDVRHEYAPGLPDGLAKEVAKTIERVITP